MPNFSTTTTQPSFGAAQREGFVPFQAWVRVVPSLGTGKRRDMLVDLEKRALRSEADLTTDAARTDGITIENVLYTVQFGESTARLTIAGFFQRNAPDSPNTVPTGDTKLIHSGTDQGEKTAVTTGNSGGSLTLARDPLDRIHDEVDLLRRKLADNTTEFAETDIIAIEYSGVKYGGKKQGGRTFPL